MTSWYRTQVVCSDLGPYEAEVTVGYDGGLTPRFTRNTVARIAADTAALSPEGVRIVLNGTVAEAHKPVEEGGGVELILPDAVGRYQVGDEWYWEEFSDRCTPGFERDLADVCRDDYPAREGEWTVTFGDYGAYMALGITVRTPAGEQYAELHQVISRYGLSSYEISAPSIVDAEVEARQRFELERADFDPATESGP